MNHIIIDSIKQMLINDIINELNIPNKNEFIITRCNEYLKDITFSSIIKPRYNKGYISNEIFKNKKNRCIANVYNDGHIRQCSNTCKKDNLCLKHFNIMNKYSKLIFGDIYNSYTDHIRKNDQKCCAVILNHGNINQCNKEISINNLCNHHYNYEIKNKKLKYGKL